MAISEFKAYGATGDMAVSSAEANSGTYSYLISHPTHAARLLEWEQSASDAPKEAEFQFSHLWTGLLGYWGVFLRGGDDPTQNCILTMMGTNRDKIYLVEVAGGTFTTLDSADITSASGGSWHTYTVEVWEDSGSIFARWTENGNGLGTDLSSGGSHTLDSGGSVGIGTWNESSSDLNGTDSAYKDYYDDLTVFYP
jgi:hypothetical protein